MLLDAVKYIDDLYCVASCGRRIEPARFPCLQRQFRHDFTFDRRISTTYRKSSRYDKCPSKAEPGLQRWDEIIRDRHRKLV